MISDLLERYELPNGMEKFARRFTTLEGFWRFCERADWMLWLLETAKPCNLDVLRTFSCHCARRWWHHIDDARLRKAVEAAEALSAGRLQTIETEQIRSRAREALAELTAGVNSNAAQAALIAVLTLDADVLLAAKTASRTSALAEHTINGTNSYEHEMEILAEQADDLRRLLGNPFPRPAPRVSRMAAPMRVN
jgi:hypothetical protein